MPSPARAMSRRRRLARSLGAGWAGASEEAPPAPLDAAIIYAPVGALVPLALRAVRKGGRVVCAGIHMSDIPSFPYDILWEERQMRLGRQPDAQGRDRISSKSPRRPAFARIRRSSRCEQANEALSQLRDGQLTGAAVLPP